MTAGASILLVEDDDATRAAVAANLAGHAYSVRSVFDGEEALREWEQARPDLVVLDIGLPGISGLDVIRRVRGRCSGPRCSSAAWPSW